MNFSGLLPHQPTSSRWGSVNDNQNGIATKRVSVLTRLKIIYSRRFKICLSVSRYKTPLCRSSSLSGKFNFIFWSINSATILRKFRFVITNHLLAAVAMQPLCTYSLSFRQGGEDPIEWDAWLVPEALQDNDGVRSCGSNKPQEQIPWGPAKQPNGSPSVPSTETAKCESSVPCWFGVLSRY